MITRATRQALVMTAQQWAPEEVCGYLVKNDQGIYNRFYLLFNRADDREDEFVTSWRDRLEIFNRHGRDRVAMWHSHPKTRPTPSKPDILTMEMERVAMAIVSLHPEPRIHLYQAKGRRIVLAGNYNE